MIPHTIRHAAGRTVTNAVFHKLAGIFTPVADRLLDKYGNAGGNIAAGRFGVEPSWIADDGKIDSGGYGLDIAGNHLRVGGRRKGDVALLGPPHDNRWRRAEYCQVLVVPVPDGTKSNDCAAKFFD